jgi:hypothetical protein
MDRKHTLFEKLMMFNLMGPGIIPGVPRWGPPNNNFSERVLPPPPQRNTIGIFQNNRF